MKNVKARVRVGRISQKFYRKYNSRSQTFFTLVISTLVCSINNSVEFEIFPNYMSFVFKCFIIKCFLVSYCFVLNYVGVYHNRSSFASTLLFAKPYCSRPPPVWSGAAAADHTWGGGGLTQTSFPGTNEGKNSH